MSETVNEERGAPISISLTLLQRSTAMRMLESLSVQSSYPINLKYQYLYGLIRKAYQYKMHIIVQMERSDAVFLYRTVKENMAYAVPKNAIMRKLYKEINK